MKPIVFALILALPLSACAGIWPGKRNAAAPVLRPQSALQQLTSGGQSAASLDQTSGAQKAAATAAPGTGRVLGIVSTALGSPAQQGFWMTTSLVSAPTKGRAVLANGQGVNVDLRPGAGAASMSLAAYRALGLGLTDLPQVQVLALP